MDLSRTKYHVSTHNGAIFYIRELYPHLRLHLFTFRRQAFQARGPNAPVIQSWPRENHWYLLMDSGTKEQLIQMSGLQ